MRVTVVAVLVAALLSGCVPSRPASSDYVVNEGGRLILRSRCHTDLVQAGAVYNDTVKPIDTAAPGSEEPEPDYIWLAHAAGERGVSEFVLFEAGQPGVEIDVWQQPVSSDREVTAGYWLASGDGMDTGVRFRIEDLGDGQVAWARGVTTAATFLRLPPAVFGC